MKSLTSLKTLKSLKVIENICLLKFINQCQYNIPHTYAEIPIKFSLFVSH